MISAVKRRQFFDRAFAWAVKATSLLVLAAVVGMLLQLVFSTLPLAESPTADLLPESHSTPAPLSEQMSLPTWVPSGISGVYWQQLDGRGLWSTVDEQSTLIGQVIRLAESDVEREEINLPPIVVAPGTKVSLVNSPRNSVLVVEPVGRYLIVNAYGEVVQHGQMRGFDSISVLPGDAGFLGIDRAIIEHWHWVRTTSGPAFMLRKRIESTTNIERVSVDATGERVLLQLANNALEVRSLLSGEKLVTFTPNDTVKKTRWVDKRHFDVEFDHNTIRRWRISGDIDGIDRSRLLDPIAYPGYSDAQVVWHPLSSTQGNPAKLNVVPLLLGTLKTAVLALLFAVPIATGAAAFVGYFMTPTHRNRVKPIIEMIAAFPTVVIGAIFAVMVAPVFFSLTAQWLGALLLTPLGIASLALSWRLMSNVSQQTRWLSMLPMLLLAPGCLLIVSGFWLGANIETQLFDGNFIGFFTDKLAIQYQSHSALLVAFAMGFAIIPSIFTVAEDAVNGVPKSLGAGSLALGASHWQSFAGVVLPVALPGIVAAVLLGFGRAIGETMILIMLSGNAANTNLNPFEAVRSIAATLAIELPDAAVASAHFQVLVLSALMLFGVSFLFNSIAQVLKRRLLHRIGQVAQ